MTGESETRMLNASQLKAVIEAERTGVPFLYWKDNEGEQHILMLGDDRTRITIGRRREKVDVSLGWDQEVSREHALLELAGEDWFLVDDGMALNGSYVNGNRIRGRHRLKDKDKMCFGKTYVFYRKPGSDEGSQSTARQIDGRPPMPLSEAQRRLLIALCRPVHEGTSTIPATNKQIADELHLSLDRVKAQMGNLFDAFGLGELPQNEKRTRLAAIALSSRLLAEHDF
jgi:DNA-binding CsgD family transcriptional regulator